MVTPEHADQVIEAFCAAESSGDRAAWLSLFAPDANLEEVGSATPGPCGLDALGEFFDETVAPLDMHLRPTARPIVTGDEALAFFEAHVGHGAERLALDRLVDHFVFDGEGRIVAVRAFMDLSATRSDPE